MRAVVVGSGAGGATAARELAAAGMEVLVLEAGAEFKPFTRRIGFGEALRRLGGLKREETIRRFFPHLRFWRPEEELLIVAGVTTGGCTSVSTGNLLRSDAGLRRIGVDLTPEFEELEALLRPQTVPRERWRPVTHRLFDAADGLGLGPKPTPKMVDVARCASCGLCELGCATGARWDSRRFLADAVEAGAEVRIRSPVRRVVVEDGMATGVEVGDGRAARTVRADVVVLAAGGIGTASILRASSLPVADRLWVDVVLTLGAEERDARALEEPPMVWFSEGDGYIISPYIDILSHFLEPRWRGVPLSRRVGLMIKLADSPLGSVREDGNVTKTLTEGDRERLDGALSRAGEVFEAGGLPGPYTEGLLNGGHLGGTVPLTPADASSMRPSGLPDGLWIADLSLSPEAQGLPTILTTLALSLRVSRRVLGR